MGLTLSYCQDWRETQTYKRFFPMRLKTTFQLKYIDSLLVRGPDWVLYTWSHSSSEPAWTWKVYNWSTSILHCTLTYTDYSVQMISTCTQYICVQIKCICTLYTDTRNIRMIAYADYKAENYTTTCTSWNRHTKKGQWVSVAYRSQSVENNF